MNTYLIGKTVNIYGTFLDPVTRYGLTPSSLTLRVKDPHGVETDVTSFTVNSQGYYSATVVPTSTGVWLYRWEASGLFYDACEGSFTVSPSEFG